MAKWIKGLILMLSISSVMGQNQHIQRGQEYFFQYCSACHSLSYIPTVWIKNLSDPWQSALSQGKWQTRLDEHDAHKWFGRAPPDLSLIGLQHSKQWIQSYLNGFYTDNQHPLGRNNIVIKQVLMPDVLFSSESSRAAIAEDISYFLMDIARPETRLRHLLGKAVLLLCFLALILTWFLRKAYNR